MSGSLGNFWPWRRPGRRIYLDYAAATPVAREVLQVMQPHWRGNFGNASAVYAEGREAKAAVEEARQSLARAFALKPEGVVFTSGGTESNQLAIFGVVEAAREAGRPYHDMEIVTSPLEHPSIAKALEELSVMRGVIIRQVPVGPAGRLDPKAVAEALSPQTVLVTCVYADSELGIAQPIREMAREIKAFNETSGGKVIFHTDAAQAPLWLNCNLEYLQADLVSLDAAKCYGPKGVGVLLKRSGVTLAPRALGGGQETGLRAGTEPTPLIVGAALALARAQAGHKERSARVVSLRDDCLKQLEMIEGVLINGNREHRLANNINVSIPGIDTEFLVVTFDTKGIAVSTKSACKGNSGRTSSNVFALYNDSSRANSTLRVTLGEETTASELNRFVIVLKEQLEKMRKQVFMLK